MIRPWGMGTTVHDDGETGYGFPETTDPTKFHPDPEMCTEKEIENHKAALAEIEAGVNFMMDTSFGGE